MGEAFSAGRLVEEIRKRFPGRKIVVSAFTYTGYETARRVISDAAVIFLPLDHPWSVKRALSTVDPSVMVFLETEIWPNMLRSGSSEGDSDPALEWAFFRAVVQQIFFIIVVLSWRAPKLCVDGDAERGRCQPCQKAWSGSGKGIRHRQFEARGIGK